MASDRSIEEENQLAREFAEIKRESERQFGRFYLRQLEATAARKEYKLLPLSEISETDGKTMLMKGFPLARRPRNDEMTNEIWYLSQR